MTATLPAPARRPVRWQATRRHLRVDFAQVPGLVAQHAGWTGEDAQALLAQTQREGRLVLWDGSLLVRDGHWYRRPAYARPLPAVKALDPATLTVRFRVRLGERVRVETVTSPGHLATALHTLCVLSGERLTMREATDLAAAAWAGATVQRGQLRVGRVRR
ncbi:hypothetical protein [Deinococcus sp. NW-56]|uniref:hypothetical protein n=1 Tax=Deinococcus sp. NW-56 TaxID=2080419 RepID=UPI001319E070|nr:hypothetical protein [Deinococcus sp. NW-56]